MAPGFKYSPSTLVLFESGELEQGLAVALELLDEARRRGTDQQAVLQHLEEVAEFSFRLEQFEIAIDARQEMLARNSVQNENQPNMAQVEDLSRLGYYYCSAKEWKLSEEYLLRGIQSIQQLPPDQRREFPMLFINRSYLAWDQRDLSQALSHLIEAWRMHIRYIPSYGFPFHRIYAQSLQEMGEWSKANRACRKALQVFDQPDFPRQAYLSLSSLHYLRGLLALHDEDLDQALSAFQHADELLKQAPRRYPCAERRAAERCAAAIAKVQARLTEMTQLSRDT